MRRFGLVVMLVALWACDGKGGTGSDNPSTSKPDTAKPSMTDKAITGAKNVVKKVDNAMDSMDTSEASDHLAHAKASVEGGGDAAEDCAWVRNAPANDAIAATVKDLKELCAAAVPLGKATKAVVAAEKAKQEQPGAPSYTECSSDSWAKAKRDLSSSSDKRWTDLQARWKAVCGDAP